MKQNSNITLWLIGINVVFFLIALLFLGSFIKSDIAISAVNIENGKIWTLVTSMFMHDPNFIGHLFMNMFSLMFLGAFVERLIGSKRFLGIYLISGIIGSLFFYLFSTSFLSSIPGLGVSKEAWAVGASGAIFGIAGMLAILTPRMPVYILFIPVAMPMWFGVIFILLIFTFLSAVAGLPIGNAAHLGGLITGVIYALYLRNKYKRKAQMIARFYSKENMR